MSAAFMDTLRVSLGLMPGTNEREIINAISALNGVRDSLVAQFDAKAPESLIGEIIAIDGHHEVAVNEEYDDDGLPIEPLVPHGRVYVTLDVDEDALLTGPQALRTMSARVRLAPAPHQEPR